MMMPQVMLMMILPRGDLDDVGSCSSHDHDATTRSPSSPHCFMSQGDTKVQIANVVDHVDSYDELVSRLASMTVTPSVFGFY